MEDATILSCRLDGEEDILLSEATAVLTADERERAGRFRIAVHAARFVRARGFLRRELAAWTGSPPGGLVFRLEGNGKPVLDGGPPFSLAHSGSLAVLAISRGGPVGVDLELMGQDVDVEGLAAEALTPEERRVLGALSGDERTQRFLAFWTAKEARMKLTGEGLSLAPSSIQLRLDGGWPVGVAAPAEPPTLIRKADLGIAGAVCSLATRAGRAVRPALDTARARR